MQREEWMRSSTEGERTPIHLYIPKGGLGDLRAWKHGELRDAGIDALWIETDKHNIQSVNSAVG